MTVRGPNRKRVVAALLAVLLVGALGWSLVPRPTVPEADSLRVLGLGDSNMSGYNCFCDGVPAEYAAAYTLRTSHPATSVNLAVGGWTTTDQLDALQSDPKMRDEVRVADVILIWIGANDMYESVDAYEFDDCDESCYLPNAQAMGVGVGQVLDEIHAIAGDHRVRVFAVGYWNVMQDGAIADLIEGPARVAFNETITVAANDAIRAATVSHDATWVDLVASFKGADAAGDPTLLLAFDGEHPNAVGVRRIARAIIAAEG